MDNFFIKTSSTTSAEELLTITNDYQTPTIEVFNPNQLTQSATNIMHESSNGYYS